MQLRELPARRPVLALRELPARRPVLALRELPARRPVLALRELPARRPVLGLDALDIRADGVIIVQPPIHPQLRIAGPRTGKGDISLNTVRGPVGAMEWTGPANGAISQALFDENGSTTAVTTFTSASLKLAAPLLIVFVATFSTSGTASTVTCSFGATSLTQIQTSVQPLTSGVSCRMTVFAGSPPQVTSALTFAISSAGYIAYTAAEIWGLAHNLADKNSVGAGAASAPSAASLRAAHVPCELLVAGIAYTVSTFAPLNFSPPLYYASGLSKAFVAGDYAVVEWGFGISPQLGNYSMSTSSGAAATWAMVCASFY
jgi:hypothetical protein